MRRRIGRAAAVALLCASTVAGCSATIMPALPKKTAAPAATAAPVATTCQTNDNLISACSRLGDLTTLDPCSLISVGQLPADLRALPQDRDSLDHCDFLIGVGKDNGAILQIGELTGGFYAKADNELSAGLDLDKGQSFDGGCGDGLQFGGDEVELEINVYGDADSQAMCAAADEVGKAVGTVIEGKTQMQHFIVPKNSIATLAACGLVPPATRIGSYQLTFESENPSHHHCEWQPDPSDEHAGFGIDLEIDQKVDDASANGHTMIDGLDTQTFSYDLGDYVRCEAHVYRASWGNAGSRLVEVASVWAAQPPGQTEAACTMARQLAAVVWPKLPPIA